MDRGGDTWNDSRNSQHQSLIQIHLVQQQTPMEKRNVSDSNSITDDDASISSQGSLEEDYLEKISGIDIRKGNDSHMITVIKCQTITANFSRVFVRQRISHPFCFSSREITGHSVSMTTIEPPYVQGIKIVPNSPLNFFYLCHGFARRFIRCFIDETDNWQKDFSGKKGNLALNYLFPERDV